MGIRLTSAGRAALPAPLPLARRTLQSAHAWAGLTLCGFGGVLLLAPNGVAHHASFQLQHYGTELASTALVLRAAGASCLLLGAAAASYPRLGLRVLTLAAVGAYLALTLVFRDWQVDDAAITYAYAENLVRGNGLVLHPAHTPEEAYSNLLWLLVLALPRALGVDVALAAKLLGTAVGAGVIALCLACVRRSAGSLRGPAFTVVVATFSTSPYVIWSVSGLEHGLQAAILLGFVWCARDQNADLRREAWLLGALASALVLTRPEAPLIVAALVFTLAVVPWRRGCSLGSVIERTWPAALLPFATFTLLIAFRVWYFGDPLPNPYYAKASDANFARLGNPFGIGWRYIAGWLVEGSGFLLVAPLCVLSRSNLPHSVVLALTVLLAQLAFVIYAGGDWMAQWRFLAAPIAVLGFLAGYAVEIVSRRRPAVASRYAALVAVAMILTNVPLLASFRAKPTTPYTEVAEIGRVFVTIAHRLGIEHPRLAHHDLGGTSYRARIDVLDLGGLGRRAIAKLFAQPDALRQLLLEHERPHFIFGSTTACAALWSHFHESELFERRYVRLQVDHPLLAHSALCHVRRDLAHAAPGIELEREHGELVRVRVRDLPSDADLR